MDIDALASFVVFAAELNFTRAAERLSISQPALFMKVRGLAESLEVPLYRRVGRRLELTEEGKKVARFGVEMGRFTDAFREELRGGVGQPEVVLAAGAGAYLHLLGPGLRSFLSRSHCRLQLLTLDRDGVLEAVASGRAQLGVATLESVPYGCVAESLCQVPQVLAMPQRHPLARRKQVRLADLNGSRLIVPPPDRPHRIVLSAALQSAGVSWEIAVEASGWELMLQFVSLDLGLAVVNGSVPMPRGLVARPLPELPQVHYYSVQRRGAQPLGEVEQLRACLQKSVSRR